MSFQYKSGNLHPAIERDRRMCAKAERNDDRGIQIGGHVRPNVGLDVELDVEMDAPRGSRRRDGDPADARRLVVAAARCAACASSEAEPARSAA
jgi:hypothetical protein